MDIKTLNDRTLDIFNAIVESYMESGDPVSSRSLSIRLENKLSSATIRNIMADLEDMGLLLSPHTSAGRIPTDKGLRFFVDAFLESQEPMENVQLKNESLTKGKNFEDIIQKSTAILSTLSQCASLVLAPKIDQTIIKHIEFLPLSDHKGLVIMVSEDGIVENRIIKLPPNVHPNQLQQATNYINHHFLGHALLDMQKSLSQHLNNQKNALDELSKKIIKSGLAVWAEEENSLIIKGQSNLLSNIQHIEDLENMQNLFRELEAKENIQQLIEASLEADGVKLFIGSEHMLFNKTGCSMILSPYQNQKGTIIGVIGVIGPISMNYRRIIPMVDYSAKLISKLLEL